MLWLTACVLEEPASFANKDEAIAVLDTGAEELPCTPPLYEPDPFVSHVVSVSYGDGAGFGQDEFPENIYGPPQGQGSSAGSLDVLSLGREGEIILALHVVLVDGEGSDLLIFENPFTGWTEHGFVAVSADGEAWHEWVCDQESWQGCAGITPVLSSPENCIDATDPAVAGGDAFDLAELPISEARFVRIRDAGWNEIGGFDLDAVAAVHWREE
jgi:hypothetical protein